MTPPQRPRKAGGAVILIRGRRGARDIGEGEGLSAAGATNSGLMPQRGHQSQPP